MIRIISGKYRGRKLPVPNAKDLRPTGDRTRGAMFNLLTHRLHRPFETLSVLDAFAGSGALGLEAVSRGARSVCFLEIQSKVVKHLQTITSNMPEDITIRQESFYRFMQTDGSAFDLIFLDPPFLNTDYSQMFKTLVASPRLARHCVCVLERPTEMQLEIPKEFAVMVDRAYGRSTVLVMEYRNESNENSSLPGNF